jgi:hypothetical protein
LHLAAKVAIAAVAAVAAIGAKVAIAAIGAKAALCISGSGPFHHRHFSPSGNICANLNVIIGFVTFNTFKIPYCSW